MDTTSVSLLERLRRPEPSEAWRRFVELYTPLIYYWSRRVGLQPEECADLVQEVLAVMVQKLPEFQYDPKQGFRGWLRTVTLNKWRENRRRRGIAMAENGQDLGVDAGWFCSDVEYLATMQTRDNLPIGRLISVESLMNAPPGQNSGCRGTFRCGPYQAIF
jgi:DNA-directed RNA polymerase specialized sigma24 family protein